MEEPVAGVSSFPPPPSQYFTYYTDESVAKGLAPAPPAVPNGPYMMFGNHYDIKEPLIQNLEKQGIRRLYPQQYDRKAELKKMNHSILTNFLDLLEILIKCPNSVERERKLDDIQVLFINMHHLINEFRPHQAYETLKLMQEIQYKERLEMRDKFRKHYEAIEGNLKSCLLEISSGHEIPADLQSKMDQFQSPGGSDAVPLKKTAPKSTRSRVDERDSSLCSVEL